VTFQGRVNGNKKQVPRKCPPCNAVGRSCGGLVRRRKRNTHTNTTHPHPLHLLPALTHPPTPSPSLYCASCAGELLNGPGLFLAPGYLLLFFSMRASGLGLSDFHLLATRSPSALLHQQLRCWPAALRQPLQETHTSTTTHNITLPPPNTSHHLGPLLLLPSTGRLGSNWVHCLHQLWHIRPQLLHHHPTTAPPSSSDHHPIIIRSSAA
jgi:hypothetical protein